MNVRCSDTCSISSSPMNVFTRLAGNMDDSTWRQRERRAAEPEA
jgi:hypothetical protein